MNDLETVARTLWGEARGEKNKGMAAVACVIVNRVRLAREYITKHRVAAHPLFGNGSFSDCCLRRDQFSCWNEGDPNREKLLDVNPVDAQFSEAVHIADDALSGRLTDITKGATHYCRIDVHPSWEKTMTQCAQIGKHAFYK
jgi:spore germination cell wall hydrolase CwlJ-like protein